MQKNKKIKQKNKSLFYFIVLITTISFVVLIVNDFGLFKLFKLKQQCSDLEKSLNVLLLQQEKLRLDINRLQTDRQYIEKIAREQFMMVLPGEKVYRVEESKNY